MFGSVDAVTVTRNGDVLAERVHDETLVFDPATQRSTRLNRTGSVVWEALDGPRTLLDLAERLEREFSVEPAAARADAEAFVRELSSRGLVTVEPG